MAILVKKPKSSSAVWNYFGLEADLNGVPLPGKEEKPVCKSYKVNVSAKGGNTSNLFTHLRDHHPDLYAEAVPTSSRVTKHQQSLREEIDKGKLWDQRSPRAQELNKAVAYFLAKDMQPLYTVEKYGFKHLVSKLDPKYTLPSRKYFAVRKQNCQSSLNYL